MADEDKDKKEPRDRIKDSATRLFAKCCFAGTSMRDLANDAGVNLAMINYYYGNKHKILESLIEDYSRITYEIAHRAFDGDDPPKEKIRRYVRDTIEVMRRNPELVQIILTEFHIDSPEIIEAKAAHNRKMAELVATHLLPSLGGVMKRPFRIEIIGPALSGMMLMHFVARPTIEKIIGKTLDDQFYEELKDEIADLALYGLIGKPD